MEYIVLTSYTINGDGEIKVHTTFKMDSSLKDFPRVGMEIVIPEGFEAVGVFWSWSCGKL